MIIYLEGVDGSGKTSLRDILESSLMNAGFKVNKYAEQMIPTNPKDEFRICSVELMNSLRRMQLNEDTVFILDRGPVSEIIYRVFDSYTPVITLSDLVYFLKINHDRRFWIIHCDTDVAERKMLERGDDNPVALTRHREIRRLYKMIMPLFNPNVNYDYTDDNHLYWVPDMIQAFKEAKEILYG